MNLQSENEALKRENEALKLKLFWKEHNYEIMNEAIRSANYVEGGYWCCCLACAVSGRHEKGYGETDKNKPCTFKPWFEQVLDHHEMSIGRGLPDVPIWVEGSVVDSGNDVLDDGQHFSNLASQDWCCWTYGSKLWKATSVGDPELVKLKNVFRYLNTLGD
jgi:hypothetical protein